MKFNIATLFLLVTVASARVMNYNVARRLDQAVAEENEYAFLGSYHLKMITCTTNVVISSQSTGESENGAIIFRLCPSSGGCSDASGKSCRTGYGDYMVGINTFVSTYLEQKRDELQSDDNFKIEQLAECRQYQADKDGDYANGVYYVGPTCTTDGTGVRLAMFSDEGCSTLEETVTFEDISAGISLPYSDGGLVSPSCESCYSVNDAGEEGLNEMCTGLYQQTGPYGKCESKMEGARNATGFDEFYCEFINAYIQQTKNFGAGTVVGWYLLAMVVVVVVVVKLVGFAMKKKKKMTTVESDVYVGVMT